MSKTFHIPKQVIYVCTGSKCKKRGGKEISKLFRSQIKDFRLGEEVEVIRTDCTDRCKFAPVMSFQPQNQWFHDVTEMQARQLFQEQVLPGAQKQDPPAAGA
ncbi:MAG: (2Fe-2S) ferredoxin domain-containing protein [Adhaeribacter sp.]